MKIILASKSPRRKELLALTGFNFECKEADIDETIDNSLSLEDAIIEVAYHKANHVYTDNKDSIVIGADTIVTLDGVVYGKPKDREDAYRMLKTFSGRIHDVITGVAIVSDQSIEKFASVTKVKMYELTDEEIYNYIDTAEPMDKAGAYGIQGIGSLLIESIDGDFYTVMGLPIAKLNRELVTMVRG